MRTRCRSIPLLLMHGANAAAADHAGHTALWLAATRNDRAVIKALLDAGVAADTHAAAEQTPLLAAVRAKQSGGRRDAARRRRRAPKPPTRRAVRR